jgi:GDP-L-fucose synthase
VDYEGDVAWDSSKPDGTPRKLLDVTRLGALGWKSSIGLAEGITKAYEDYLARLVNDRLQARVSE